MASMRVLPSAGGGWDRGDAGHAGEVGVAGEALGAGGLADQDCSGEGAAAGLLEQLWAVDANEGNPGKCFVRKVRHKRSWLTTFVRMGC
jgi:hypothetical protein